MKSATEATKQTGCTACRTHSRPLYVPWHQHAIGCALRAAALREQQLQLQALRVASNVAAF